MLLAHYYWRTMVAVTQQTLSSLLYLETSRMCRCIPKLNHLPPFVLECVWKRLMICHLHHQIPHPGPPCSKDLRSRLLESAYRTQESLLGPNHPDTLVTLREKAEVGWVERKECVFRCLSLCIAKCKCTCKLFVKQFTFLDNSQEKLTPL